MTSLFDPVVLTRGPGMKNRFMLSPLTNLQSHVDGTLSDDEYHWLTLRARGGFGATMTCASHVQAQGQGFPGQLGCWSDAHLPGTDATGSGVRAAGSTAYVQLHHAGMRSPKDLIGTQPVCPSDDAETGSRALTLAEVEQLRDDFIAAAVRSERAGFDGVELHGAHGYVLSQFLSSTYNRRTTATAARSRIAPARLRHHRWHPRPLPSGLHARHPRFAGALRMLLGEMRTVVQRPDARRPARLHRPVAVGRVQGTERGRASSRSRWSTGSRTSSAARQGSAWPARSWSGDGAAGAWSTARISSRSGAPRSCTTTSRSACARIPTSCRCRCR